MQYMCVKNREVNKLIIWKWTLFETLVLPAGISLSQLPPYQVDFQKRMKTRRNYLFP